MSFKEGLSYLGWINKEVNNPSLDSIVLLIEQLAILNKLNFNISTIETIPRKRLLHYADAFTRLNPSDLKGMPDYKRCSLLLIYSYIKREKIIDKLINMFNRIIRNVVHKSEKRVVKKLISGVKKVYGKDKLKNIIEEYKKKGPKYQRLLHQQIRSSYASYYRRMVQPLLENVVFRSNNKDDQSILESLSLIKKYFSSTEMSVQKSYVDTHGQSEIGFAFSHLLGFSLMPRFANLHKQKLAQCELGDYQQYKNLQPILSDTINWQLIKEQYHQIVKYTAAMKSGHANPESILRRFTKNNLKHPIYTALSQLGKALKTIFICNYLMHESIRQEIQEGLNVV